MKNGPLRFQVKTLDIKHAAIVGIHNNRNTQLSCFESANDLYIQTVTYFYKYIQFPVFSEKVVDITISEAIAVYLYIEIRIYLRNFPCSYYRFLKSKIMNTR